MKKRGPSGCPKTFSAEKRGVKYNDACNEKVAGAPLLVRTFCPVSDRGEAVRGGVRWETVRYTSVIRVRHGWDTCETWVRQGVPSLVIEWFEKKKIKFLSDSEKHENFGKREVKVRSASVVPKCNNRLMIHCYVWVRQIPIVPKCNNGSLTHCYVGHDWSRSYPNVTTVY